MIYTLALIALTVIFAVACVVFRSKNKSFYGMICKFMASFGFIAITVYGNWMNGGANLKYFSFITIALMFGFCGDIFLGIKEVAPSFRKKLIIMGTAYFLVGHIFYLLAFHSIGGINLYTFIAGIAGIGAAAAIIKIAKMMLKPAFAVLLSIYYGLLFWKIAAAISLLIAEVTTANIFILAGCVLFLISDTCLGLLYFTPIKRKNLFVTVELSTYYPAQILLALSVMLMK
ncbi:MAG: lysoplasmalogenase [Clostridia bacterium]|nr:lysoplasmalogenase [Clostridia bacterium]